MPRNADFILSPAQAANVATRTRQLAPLPTGTVVTLEYVKRDGTASSSTGPVESVEPKRSHGIVVLDTVADKGRPTSVNLWGITKVTVHK